MDIDSRISSSITKNGDLYEIELPNFYGFVEGVLYMHKSQILDYCSGIFGEKLDLGEWRDPLERIFLISQVFGILLIRIIHTLDPKNDTIIAAKAAKIITFQIRDTAYYGILYYNENGELGLITDFEDSEIFRSSFENGIWTISNTLTGINLHCFSFPLEISENESNLCAPQSDKVHFYILEDPLFPEKKEKKFIEKLIGSLTSHKSHISETSLDSISEMFTKVSISSDKHFSREDFVFEIKKLIGIIGNHLIITEETDFLPGFLSIEDAETSGIESIESFTLSDEIEYFDPKWHELRVMLLELRYLVYSIEKHILLTKKSLSEIEEMDSPYLKHQAYRSTLTLEGLQRIKHQYQLTLETLLRSIKKSQNLI